MKSPNYWVIGLLVILLIILILVVIYLVRLTPNAADTAVGLGASVLGSGNTSSSEPLTLVDGLNYIHKNIRIENSTQSPNDVTLIAYPDTVQIHKYLHRMRLEYPGELIVVLKNQDGYYLSKYDANLYELLAEKLKCTIMVAYDPNPPQAEHISRARDDDLLLKVADSLKQSGRTINLISNDKFRDHTPNIGDIPPYQILRWPKK